MSGKSVTIAFVPKETKHEQKQQPENTKSCVFKLLFKRTRRDSNPRSSESESDALSTRPRVLTLCHYSAAAAKTQAFFVNFFKIMETTVVRYKICPDAEFYARSEFQGFFNWNNLLNNIVSDKISDVY